MLAACNVVHGFLRLVGVRATIGIGVLFAILMVQHVRGMFGKVLDGERHRVAAAQHVRQVTFRGDNGLPWK